MGRYFLMNIMSEDPVEAGCINTSGMEDWEVREQIGSSKSDFVEEVGPETIEENLTNLFGGDGWECLVLEDGDEKTAYWRVKPAALVEYREHVRSDIVHNRIPEVRKLLTEFKTVVDRGANVKDMLFYRIRNGILSWCAPCIMTGGGSIDLLEKWVITRDVPEEGIFVTDAFLVHY